MIITRTPVRISLFGGSSDYHDFITRNGYGMVVSAAINQYVYVSVKKLPDYFSYKTKITYSEVECVQDNRDIKHRVFYNALKLMDLLDEPLEINYTADIPGRMGLGTSSSFIVGLVNALYWYKYRNTETNYDRPMRRQLLFEMSSFIEQQMMGETVGYQDYCPAIWGGLAKYKFLPGNPIEVTHKRYFDGYQGYLEKYGLLVYVKQDRDASSVAKTYIDDKRFQASQKFMQCIAEGFPDPWTMQDRFSTHGDVIKDMAVRLQLSWDMKRSISGISNNRIDQIWAHSVVFGNDWTAGKLLGAGAGGCIFFLAPTEKHDVITQYCRSEGCAVIPFEIAGNGSEKIYG